MHPLHSPLRFWVAGLLLIAGAVHVPLIPEHLEEAPYVGVLFLLLVVVCVALAALLLRDGTRGAWGATAAVMALAFVAYLISRTAGLPQLRDDIGNWGEPLAVPALFAEAFALAASLYALLHPTSAPTPRDQP